MDLKKKYYTQEGIECNILQLVKMEPEWAAERIQATENRWIPVEERRPEENKGVLVHYEDGEISKRYLEGRYFLPIRVVAVTHWMPLPEAPE